MFWPLERKCPSIITRKAVGLPKLGWSRACAKASSLASWAIAAKPTNHRARIRAEKYPAAFSTDIHIMQYKAHLLTVH